MEEYLLNHQFHGTKAVAMEYLVYRDVEIAIEEPRVTFGLQLL